MKVNKIDSQKVVAELSRDELLAINNALNEVLHGLDIWDFPIRMGVERKEAEVLLDEIGNAFEKMKKDT